MKRPCASGLGVVVGLALCSAALAQSRGPDVIVGTLYSPTVWGSAGGYTGYSVGTYSCNRGDKLLSWIASTPAHPVIAQNLFRYTTQANGGSRFEQIGQSWLKHGFTALQGNECSGDANFPYALYTANPAGGTGLGWGASDPYSSSLNGGQSSAGPKSDVNATTGVFAYPPTISGGTGDVTWRRLRVLTTDVTSGGGRMFYEGQYIAADDCANGNRNNSVSWVESNNLTNGEALPATNREQPAIQAWANIDSAVKLVPVDVPGDGRYWLGWRVTSNGNGTWDYEYAIHNLNSDRSGGSFTVPFGAGSAPTNFGTHYVEYHSGEIWANTPWTFTNSGGTLTWSSPATFASNPNTNALRWGTLYNFRFTASSAPVSGSVALGLFKPGSGAYAGLNQMVIAADVPGGATVAGAPINDLCPAAVPMYGTKVGFSTANATSSGPAECAGKSSSTSIDNDIWFSYQDPTGCSGTLVVDTLGSSFDTRLAIYASCPDASSSALACNDDDSISGTLQSRVSFTPTPGATYLIRVGGYNGATGNGVLSVTPSCPTGACCQGTSCQLITATACSDMCSHSASASYGGDGTTCTPNNCTSYSGACCSATDGSCTAGSSGACCASSGLYQGHGSVCSPSPCPGAGRCCNTTTGACTMVLQGVCSGTWTSTGTCSTPCAGTGACCNNATGVCSMIFSSACGSGSSFNGAASCSPSPCPVGACCNNVSGACVSAIQTGCGSGSTWFTAACTANPCPQPPPPSNDNCANAIALYDNVPYTGSNITATTDYPGSASLNCGSGDTSNQDVWFKYTPAVSGNVRVTTMNNFSGDATNFDTVVSVHAACGTSAAILACNDDNGIGGTPSLSSNIAAVNLTAGATYLIRVAGYTGSTTATGTYTVRIIGGGAVPPTPPANDDCQNRQGVGVGAPIPFDTTNATTDGPMPGTGACSFASQIDKDIWYNYPAQTTGNLTVSLCGSSFDTRLAIYHTSLCAQINDTTLVACNDNFACAGGGNGLQSQLTVPVILGDSYTIRVGGTGGAGGAGTMLLSDVSTLGACCDSAGACHTLTQTDCTAANGNFRGLPSTCSPTPCPQPGACCNASSGACSLILQASCGVGSIWNGASSCTTNPCQPPTGACCIGTACSITTAAGCTGTFQGVGVLCGTTANPTTCCIANFNQTGGITIQDVFDFLAGWFAGDPRADINGGGLAVSDIFSFLNLWFAGC